MLEWRSSLIFTCNIYNTPTVIIPTFPALQLQMWTNSCAHIVKFCSSPLIGHLTKMCPAGRSALLPCQYVFSHVCRCIKQRTTGTEALYRIKTSRSGLSWRLAGGRLDLIQTAVCDALLCCVLLMWLINPSSSVSSVGWPVGWKCYLHTHTNTEVYWQMNGEVVICSSITRTFFSSKV